ncbi:hypothetical protein [Vibrio coralliilyticus]|uniref:hypothetical protein n=1 Tax=Vibrio coralliilyticus TaxID=190893 RepID=UPI001561755D|nr:hypothetical protein [Vibrio coralliilyticus]NRF16391.1 hypothetical protein [Vibrio coralliilyticus]
MLLDWFKSDKPNVYLGSLAVVSEDHFSKIESFFSFSDSALQDHMRRKLEEVFCLSSKPSIQETKPTDIGLDVVIVTLHGGDAFAIEWGPSGIPVFWRPKIKLVSRLYHLKSGKTIKTFKVSQSITWIEFTSKLFSLRGLFRFGSLYNNQDMELLLYQASLKLLDKMRKSVQ